MSSLHRRRARRADSVITALAAAVALWLGLTAPSVSPVAPPPPSTVNAPPVAAPSP